MGAITFQYDILVNRQTVPELTADYTIPTGSTAEKSRDPKGNETTKVTDAAGRLIYVISEGKVTAYSYDENGNRSKVVYPDGKTKEEYEYYKDNLLKKLTNIKADGTTMDEYSYSYDGAHNQTSKTEIINGKEKGTTSYSYDKLNRLIKIQEPIKETETAGRITSYTYDAAGNRETERTTTSKAAAAKTTLITYKYNEQNRLMSATEETGDGTKKTTTYTYDGNGNMTRKSMEQTRQIDPSNAPKARFGIYIEGQAEGATKNAKPIVSAIASYEYNVWNQLKKATTAEGISTYKYNGEGYRTEKTENGKTTISLYEADKVILEADANGKEIARNLYGTNLITRTVTETENSTTQKTSYNYMYNGHGDVTALLTQDGTIAASYYYDAFGTAVETHYYNASGEETDKAVNNPYRYAGYVFDSTTDLYYLNARYYDSKIARFMSEDTYTGEMNDPLSLNLYTYCYNNPIAYSDYSGHKPVTITSMGILFDVDSSELGWWESVGWGVFNGEVSGDIHNYSNVSEINISNGSNVKITNHNDYTIGTINTGTNSNTNINNKGTIVTINTGSSSATSINNSGYIKTINTGAFSSTDIKNSGTIDSIILGEKSTYNITGNAAGSYSVSYSSPLCFSPNIINYYNVNERLTEEELRNELNALIKMHLKAIEQYKNIGYYSTDESIDIVLKYDKKISEVSEQLGVPKAMIQAILFKEIRMQDARDTLADSFVIEYYDYKHELERYNELSSWQKLFYPVPIPSNMMREDSSTGLGQIFASTAIAAYNEGIKRGYILGQRIDYDNWHQREKVWNDLRDNDKNIFYVGVVLKYEAIRLNVDLNDASDNQLASVLARYNGTGSAAAEYGKETKQYYNVFNLFNK